jgi:hypothetical protein
MNIRMNNYLKRRKLLFNIEHIKKNIFSKFIRILDLINIKIKYIININLKLGKKQNFIIKK